MAAEHEDCCWHSYKESRNHRRYKMRELKAKMFNKKASDPKNKPAHIIEAIGLKYADIIADIGAGGGYFSLRFAEIVGEKGKVYAVDTNKEFLEFIKNSAKKKGLKNIITLLITEDKMDLPEESLDFIFMRNVTHHIPNRVKYFKNLRMFLKSNGRIIIIEYKKGKPFTFRGMFGHYVPKDTIVREMGEAGYVLEKEFDFLPEQNFTVYLNTPLRQA
ncbi:MAG: methyltransferase domain-containing protein [Peptococcaceae bacterium]|nr:class I SAM-dependent methyltransferase [Peptococcaceae bacterium]MDH7524663.1 methyltransferase domain-containing protein [Peptococcaceae bacterium]